MYALRTYFFRGLLEDLKPTKFVALTKPNTMPLLSPNIFFATQFLGGHMIRCIQGDPGNEVDILKKDITAESPFHGQLICISIKSNMHARQFGLFCCFNPKLHCIHVGLHCHTNERERKKEQLSNCEKGLFVSEMFDSRSLQQDTTKCAPQ